MATGGTPPITEEETNHLRAVYLCYVIAPEAVRSFFDNIHTNLVQDLAAQKSNLGKIRAIQRFQWDQLYPPVGQAQPMSTDFDISLLICLLRNMNPTVKPPPLGFDQLPQSNDKSDGANIARIKYYRNTMAHSKNGKMSNTEFHKMWNDMEIAINGLANNKFRIRVTEVKSVPLDGHLEDILKTCSHLEELTTQGLEKMKGELKMIMQDTNQKIKEDVRKLDEKVIEQNVKLQETNQEIETLKKTKPHPIPGNIQEQFHYLLEKWTEEKRNFITRNAVDEVLTSLKNNKSVTVTGSSGTGKTALVKYVACMMKDEGYTIVPTTKPDDIRNFSQKGFKMLFVFDDVLGNYSMNMSAFEIWDQKDDEIKQVLKRGDSKVICTCRLDIFQNANFKELSILNDCICNLSSKKLELNDVEKLNIANMTFKENAIMAVESLGNFDCFPLLCSLYNNLNREAYTADLFIKNPFKFYEMELNKISKGCEAGKLKFCCLALCVVYNNKLKTNFSSTKNEQERMEDILDKCRLSRGTSIVSLMDSAETLIGTYFVKKDIYERYDSYKLRVICIYSTVHDKLFDFLSYYMGSKMVEVLIKHADSKFIGERLVCGSNDCTVCIKDEFAIPVPNKSLEEYVERLTSDLLEGKFAVLSDRNLKCHKISNHLLKFLQSLPIDKQSALINTKDKCKNTMFSRCCHFADLKFTKWIIYTESCINKTMSWITNYCIDAVMYNLPDLVRELNDKISFDIRNGNDETALNCPLEMKNKNTVKELKALDPNIIMDGQGNTSLHLAVLGEEVDMLEELLKIPAIEIDSYNDQGDTPLHCACLFGKFKVVRKLLDMGANPKLTNAEGDSCLHVAAKECHEKVIRELLDKDITLMESYNNEGYTAVEIINPEKDICKELLLKGADVEVSNEYNNRCLQKAVSGGYTDVVFELLKKKPININSCDDSGETLLYRACQNGNLEVVRKLLDMGADYKINNEFGDSFLHVAIWSDHAEVVHELLDKDINVLMTLHTDGESPLDYVMNCGTNRELVKELLLKGACVEVSDEYSNTCLLEAVSEGYIDVVSELLKKKTININSCDDEGLTPLYVACLKGDLEVVKKLLDMGANFKTPLENGVSCFHVAVCYGELDIVSEMLDRDTSIIDSYDHQNKTPLYHACDEKVSDPLDMCAKYNKGEVNLLKKLLDMGANYKITNKDGYSCLHAAALCGKLHIVRELLDKDISIMDSCNDKEETPLHLAFKNGKVDVVKELLLRGAKVELADKEGNSCLHMAALSWCSEIVSQLLTEHSFSIDLCNNWKETPLHLACQNGSLAVVKKLIEKGANLNEVDGKRNSCLHFAISNKAEVLCELLDSNRIDINYPNCHNETPLYMAGEKGNNKAVKELLMRGANVEVTNEKGNSCLHSIASNCSSQEIVELLTKHSFSPDLYNHRKETPLHLACQSGNLGLFKELLKRGANLKEIDGDGNSCLHFAALHYNVTVICELLYEKTVDINLRNCCGETPLYKACKFGYSGLVRELLLRGANAELTYEDGNSCLHIAASSSCCEAVTVIRKLLNETTKNINLLNCYQETPLHIACRTRWNYYIVKELLLRGANVELTNIEGNSCLHTAALHGHTETVIELLKTRRIIVHSYNKLGQTPLYIACEIGNADVVKQLLSLDVDFNISKKYRDSCKDIAFTNGHTVLCEFLNEDIKCKKDMIENEDMVQEEETIGSDISEDMTMEEEDTDSDISENMFQEKEDIYSDISDTETDNEQQMSSAVKQSLSILKPLQTSLKNDTKLLSQTITKKEDGDKNGVNSNIDKQCRQVYAQLLIQPTETDQNREQETKNQTQNHAGISENISKSIKRKPTYSIEELFETYEFVRSQNKDPNIFNPVSTVKRLKK